MSYSENMLAALADGNLKQAKKDFQRALQQDSDDLLYSLAENLYALGFLPEARKVYLKLLAKYPDEDELRTTLADIAISDGKTEQALDYLQAIQPDSPAYAESLLVSADLYQQQGLYEVSEQKLLEARRLYPDETVIAFALAEFYFDSGEFQKAIVYYEELIAAGEVEISKVNLYQRLGVAYANSGAFEKAAEYLDLIPTAEMSAETAFQAGFIQLQLKDYQAAEKLLSELREQDSQFSSLYPYLATAQEKQAKLTDALRTLQEGMAVDAYNEVLYQRAADLAFRLDDEALGEKYLQHWLALVPDDMTAIVQLSNLYVKQGRHDENIALLTPVADRGDADPQAYWNLAVSADAQDETKVARENYLLAYPTFKNQPDFLHQLILFFQSVGQRTEMLTALKRYVKLVPTDDEMAWLLESTEEDN
ncbi:tetratricopeptide repeat protein [Loigolactobacillus bifermentans]|uniref:TPR repeat-containing protein n=1 Tax=Loigolactobacillus bifermentans DSM 20003 TaxID=1423726 RepID=A0A0R1GJH0_9LACO|nr:tetratricopeptide repeat protein [Loigolactobacillus bifermentans]KRK34252.1 TPR repeat-containing protein [Loigolactobacillus bifermentans DSM 20003]QGG59364.1 tetratricopeptide repeat protein [Loigolactobacillus bifermentans]